MVKLRVALTVVMLVAGAALPELTVVPAYEAAAVPDVAPDEDTAALTADVSHPSGALTENPEAPVPANWRARIAELAARYDISPRLLEAVVWQESRWRVGARSPVGARGLPLEFIYAPLMVAHSWAQRADDVERLLTALADLVA